jgi:hypothetical protein
VVTQHIAVVAGEDQNRIVQQLLLSQQAYQQSDLVIDMGTLGIERLAGQADLIVIVLVSTQPADA